MGDDEVAASSEANSLASESAACLGWLFTVVTGAAVDGAAVAGRARVRPTRGEVALVGGASVTPDVGRRSVWLVTSDKAPAEREPRSSLDTESRWTVSH